MSRTLSTRTAARALVLGPCLWLISQGAARAQCAMCNTAARGSAVGWSLSVSVLFMLAALFLIVGWLVLLIARTARAGRSREQSAAPKAT